VHAAPYNISIVLQLVTACGEGTLNDGFDLRFDQSDMVFQKRTTFRESSIQINNCEAHLRGFGGGVGAVSQGAFIQGQDGGGLPVGDEFDLRSRFFLQSHSPLFPQILAAPAWCASLLANQFRYLALPAFVFRELAVALLFARLYECVNFGFEPALILFQEREQYRHKTQAFVAYAKSRDRHAKASGGTHFQKVLFHSLFARLLIKIMFEFFGFALNLFSECNDLTSLEPQGLALAVVESVRLNLSGASLSFFYGALGQAPKYSNLFNRPVGREEIYFLALGREQLLQIAQLFTVLLEKPQDCSDGYEAFVP
jgi:hypothetical protein